MHRILVVTTYQEGMGDKMSELALYQGYKEPFVKYVAQNIRVPLVVREVPDMDYNGQIMTWVAHICVIECKLTDCDTLTHHQKCVPSAATPGGTYQGVI